MAEVIGIVAAAFQLAAACMRLMETIKTIKGSSKTLKEYQKQLQDLRNLSATIGQNPILQTAEVNAHTQSLLVLISEHNFEPLLRKNRFLRSLRFLNTQRDLLDILDTIEKRKTSLSLVILSIEAKTLDQIRVDVKSMATPTLSRSQSIDCDTDKDESSGIFGNNPTCEALVKNDFNSKELANQELTTKGLVRKKQSSWDSESPHGCAGNPSSKSTTSDSNSAYPGHFFPTADDVAGAVASFSKVNAKSGYYGSYAGPGVSQINGSTYDSVRPDRKLEQQPCHIGARKEGPGYMTNKNHVKVGPEADVQSFDPNVYQDDALHFFPQYLAKEGAAPGTGTSTMNNGTVFERKE